MRNFSGEVETMSRILIAETQTDLASAHCAISLFLEHYTVHLESKRFTCTETLRDGKVRIAIGDGNCLAGGLDGIGVVRSYRAAGWQRFGSY